MTTFIQDENKCNNSDILPNISSAEQFNTIIYSFVIPTICVLGIIFNVINLLVLSSKILNESPYIYLTGLACADLLSLLLFLLSGIARGMYPDTYGWSLYQSKIYSPIGSMSTMASIVLTVALTIERYTFVVMSLKYKAYCTPQTASRVTFTIYVICAIYNIPHFYATEVDENNHLNSSSFGESQIYRAYSIFDLAVISFGSCAILAILNLLLIRTIYLSEKSRSQLIYPYTTLQRKMKDQNRLTVTLVVLICVFLVGELPSACVNRLISKAIYGDKVIQGNSYKIANTIATVLVTLQHAVNFFIYCVMNKKFRKAFQVQVLKCKKKANQVGVSP